VNTRDTKLEKNTTQVTSTNATSFLSSSNWQRLGTIGAVTLNMRAFPGTLPLERRKTVPSHVVTSSQQDLKPSWRLWRTLRQNW